MLVGLFYLVRKKIEQKFPISTNFRTPPNIDVVINNISNYKFRVFAIECKFSEPYRKHQGIKPKYLDILNLWDDVPNIHKLAEAISPDDKKYKYLHTAQLIKHILGLKNKFGKTKFRLLYLWYDTIGPESADHHREITDFIKVAKADGVHFHAMTYQELIVYLSNKYRKTLKDYINYLTERYL